MTERLLFLAALVVLVFGGLDWDQDDRASGRLWWVRVSPTRTVEVWRKGWGIRVIVMSRR
ncbi:hypothetical protein ACIPLC_01725 [Kitasatospora sp. NPDC086801]|uniref:hypothetical protein n=1 Tax=Kitasatospora sp. NPDC086801 TaxID=3364066 RepID=UPI0037F18710